MSKERKADDLFSPVYAKRQFVVVFPDQFFESHESKRDGVEMRLLKNLTKDTLMRGLATGLVGLAINAATEGWEAYKRARENGFDALPIKLSEAASLSFPPGHPQIGRLYVGHPADPDLYYTVASFHRVTFEHKFSEAIRLLMHLGATKMRVEHVSGWSSEFAAKLSVPIQTASASVSAGAQSENQKSLLFEASLPSNKSKALPENLVWYPHEQTWKSMAEGRLNFGLTEFNLVVNYEDDFGVNAKLEANAKKAGFDLGGTFNTHQATAWRISGSFADLATEMPNTR